jgi:hypothetical protein
MCCFCPEQRTQCGEVAPAVIHSAALFGHKIINVSTTKSLKAMGDYVHAEATARQNKALCQNWATNCNDSEMGNKIPSSNYFLCV